MTPRYLNLACGDFYVKNSEWLNLDWYPHSDFVRKANLLTKLEYPDGTFDAVYTSHFIEHIPKENLQFVLTECFRVLKPNGVIRVVVPDFENIVREYIHNLDNSSFEKAEFNIVELIDQCVRSKSGGNLAVWRGRSDLTEEFRDYISSRTGYIYKIPQREAIVERRKNFKVPKITKTRLQWLYCWSLTKLMPAWFVQNHINFTNTGELHKWVYDENVLSKNLAKAGFIKIIRCSSHESGIENFPFVPLDQDENGNIRKGAESMYIEATAIK